MYSAYFRLDRNLSNDFSQLGSSPLLLKKLIEWLNSKQSKLKELKICIYLFNNHYFYDFIKRVAAKGCKVTIYTIPLEGYDDRYPKKIKNIDGKYTSKSYTKYDLAKIIYDDFINNNYLNLDIRIVPHMYLRSSRVRPFSRGAAPYSLHCKSIMIKLSNNENYIGVTSSNMSVRDKEKIESSVLIKADENEIISAEDFYYGLYENSISLKCYDNHNNYSNFEIKMRDRPEKSRVMYTAPFYRDSNLDFEKNLIKMINHAQKQIVICSQHISAYRYTVNKAYNSTCSSMGWEVKYGFLKNVLQKAANGVKVTFLSQTYTDSTENRHRVPINKKAFVEFIREAKKNDITYYVNQNNHSKFIIIDDHVIITTLNFTPTQFIYLDNVNIQKFDNIPNYQYKGIHSEFGCYIVVSSKEFSRCVLDEFKKLLDSSDTIQEN